MRLRSKKRRVQVGLLLACAAAELEQAVDYQPDLAQAYCQLARAYAGLGQTEKSAQALAQFNALKKHEVDEERDFQEQINKDLETP